MTKQILMLIGWVVLIYVTYRLSVWVVRKYERSEPEESPGARGSEPGA